MSRLNFFPSLCVPFLNAGILRIKNENRSSTYVNSSPLSLYIEQNVHFLSSHFSNHTNIRGEMKKILVWFS